MGDIIYLQGKRTFSLKEAKRLLPVVKKITHLAVESTQQILAHLEVIPKESPEREKLENDLNFTVDDWAKRLTRLGCDAKGLWLVDFDNGNGYYCWQYGEAEISHIHGYEEGFAGRRQIIDTIPFGDQDRR